MKRFFERCYALARSVLQLLGLCFVRVGMYARVGTPCKLAKPDPRIITHEDGALENPDWKCVPVGYNAQLKGPVFWCTNKVSGAVWQITILPVNAKSKD
jgi:hypothetical protein